MQVKEMIPCDKDGTVQVHYIIQGRELKKEQEVLSFFYLVCYELLVVLKSFLMQNCLLNIMFVPALCLL